ncbi:MAG: hypothetical protein RLO12_03600 [Fulvivirga sp.]
MRILLLEKGFQVKEQNEYDETWIFPPESSSTSYQVSVQFGTFKLGTEDQYHYDNFFNVSYRTKRYKSGDLLTDELTTELSRKQYEAIKDRFKEKNITMYAVQNEFISRQVSSEKEVEPTETIEYVLQYCDNAAEICVGIDTDREAFDRYSFSQEGEDDTNFIFKH